MSIMAYLSSLLFAPKQSPERRAWTRQEWHGQPNYDLRVRIGESGASITYWRDGHTWRFWVKRGEFGALCLLLLRRKWEEAGIAAGEK